jgi:hypothetical protein
VETGKGAAHGTKPAEERPALLYKAVKEALHRDFPHLHGILGNAAPCRFRERIFLSLLINRDYAEIGVACKARIELDLLTAEEMAFREGGEIEKTESNGFLDLIDEVVAQKNVGYVGLEMGDLKRRIRVMCRIEHESK